MFQKGTDLALTLDVSCLAGLPSVMADEVAGLARKRSRHGATKFNMCLITLNNSANDLGVLSNVLSLFGGGFSL